MKKRIQVNHLGYMVGMPKSAICRVASGVFYLVDASSGANVYAGRLTCSFFDRESGETVRLADFSDYNVCGSYFVRAGYRRSDIFEIAPEPYKNVRKTILDGIFACRCGCDLSSKKDRCRAYVHGECHTELAVKNGRQADASGGWHCGGGYNKSTRTAALTTADMLYALKLFSSSFSAEERALIRDECRWGLEWLLKMQDHDGGVFDGVFADGTSFVLPEDDNAEYVFGKKSCSAALVFTAAAALGADYFSGVDSDFSRRLRRGAEKGWIAALQTEEYSDYRQRFGSTSETGEGLSPLESEFMWAMCEMYALTGEESFEKMINEKYMLSSFSGFGYSSCGGFAALSYLMSSRKKDRTADAFIRKRLTDKADRMCIALGYSGYRTARSAGSGYGYGSNLAVLSDCMDFIAAYLISGEQKYLSGAVDQFAYIFGRNPMGIAYMTGCGGDCCTAPCHVPSAVLANDKPLAGMIVGGANSSRSDDYSKWHIDKDTPAAKCYTDNVFSVSTNEPSVHYSAPVIFVSAFYDKVGKSTFSGIK